jgi:inosine-uridine nucleoside N-ribohydrolase
MITGNIFKRMHFVLGLALLLMTGCHDQESGIRTILDTDTNNELDDQHALAYMLCNGNVFDVEGVTVNATRAGGNIDSQYEEAKRIIQLFGLFGKIPLHKGAGSLFDSIKNHAGEESFDGSDAVRFIIEKAHEPADSKLVVIAVGKLTNLALALHRDPTIAPRIRLVWLGSNYPEYGEYNLDNDTASVNYVLNTDVELEIATVRGGRYTGTYAVSTTMSEIAGRMPGKGPSVEVPVRGRDGKYYTNFGDYSVSLFQNMGGSGKPDYSRPLFDMAAVAIVKNPSFAKSFEIPAPVLRNRRWIERPGNKRKVTIREHFDKEGIIGDFYKSMENYTLAGTE